MIKILKSKFFKFAAFAAKSHGITQVQPVVVHRNGTADIYGRFGRRR